MAHRQTLSGDYIAVVTLPDGTTWSRTKFEHKTMQEADRVSEDFLKTVKNPKHSTLRMYGYVQDNLPVPDTINTKEKRNTV